MTPEVKERIEQIQHGIVPDGYKKGKDGIFPADWETKPMNEWLTLAERPITLEDDKEYQLITVRRGFGGVDSRGFFYGRDILVKNYFVVHAGDFVISKRQIAHGACGVVPASLDGAVVSNEYNVFVPNEGTNIEMFSLMMQLPHYTRLFYLMSDGVHIEKLLFKTEDWLKRSIAMPNAMEQERIAEILDSQHKAISLLNQLYQEEMLHKKHLHKVLLSVENSIADNRYTTVKMSDLCCFISESGTGFKCDYVSAENMEPDLGGHVSFPSSTESVEGIRYSTNDVLISNIRPYLQKVWLADKCGICSTDVLVARAKVISPVQLYYLIANEMFFNEIMKTAKGSKMPRGDKKQILQMKVKIPQGKEQQEKATLVFQSTDRSLHLLKNRIELEKQKEKALMQLLLTGMVRV